MVATSLATIYVQVIGERAAFLLFFFGVIQVSFWLGLYPGIVAAILSLASVNLFVLLPTTIEVGDVVLLNAGFCFVSAVMVVTTSFHRQLAEALWESRQDFLHAQTLGQIGSWRLNVARNELIWSDENHRIFGIPKTTPMTYEAFLAIVHPDDREFVDRMWQAGLRGEPYDIEHRLVVAGKVKWVREKAILEFDNKGNLLGGFGITQDVTRRIDLQDQLTKVAASVPGLICSFRLNSDGSACMPYASPVIDTFYGIGIDVVSKDFNPVFARIHPDDIGRIHASIAESAHSQQPWRDTYRYNHPTKGEVWHEGHSLPIREADGSILWHGYVHDVTERKLAENTLRDREAQLRLIMDATPALISYLDLDFRYLRVNATYEKWFGMPAEQILGRQAEEVLGTAAWQTVSTYLQRARDGETVSFDQQIPYGTGGPRWVHVTYLPNIGANGVVRGIVVHVFDISERVASEQKITLLNQRLQRRVQEMQVIFNTVPIGLSIAESADGKHIRGNSVLERMMGLPPKSELSLRQGFTAGICIKQNGAELAIDDLPMERAIRGELVSNQVIEVIRPGHKVVSVLCNTSPLLNEDGMPRGALGAFMDISALKHAERSVRESEAFVRDVLNSLPEHIAVLDEHGLIAAVNEPWERFAIENGSSASKLSVGANYLDVCRRSSAMGDPEATKVLEGLEALLSGTESSFVMEYACHTQKRTLWFLMHAKRFVHGDKAIIITHVDITEHKLAEIALREYQTRLALIVDQVKAGYWDWDLTDRRLFLSPEAKQQIGLDGCDIPSRREEWEERLHPDDRAFVLKLADDYIAGLQTHYEVQFRFRHQDGNYRWFHSRGVLLSDLNNSPYRMLGINLDITDYMRQKQLSGQRDKIERSFRLYVAVQTAAAIAHELNQPLAAISSYADVALHLLQTDSSNQQKLSHLLENCSTQAQRAGDVMRQLLALLQKEEIPSEALDINLAIQEAVDLVNVDEFSHAFIVETDLAIDLPPVMANALQVQKVLINLLRNGLESMQEYGESACKIAVISRRSALDSSMVQVTVRDSGKGVEDDATLRKLFRPFYTTKPKGLGMGLVISRSLIMAHGGKMWAEKNTDQGLSIHFTLPFAL
ncbi:hypothetical protein C2U68_18000 [Methylomonas koyamae]|nr:hypothetical protein C2U68_18000 [Methylomonas koyamae]